MSLASPEDVLGIIRSALSRESQRAPREVVNRYINLVTSDPILHIRIRELREKAFAAPRRNRRNTNNNRREPQSDDEAEAE